MLETLLQKYGYLATGLGCLLEGEMILLVAAFLAHQGYLKIVWIIAAAACGALAGEVITFELGRRKADAILSRFKFVRRHLPKAQSLLQRYGVSSLFLMRFSYGLRALSGLVCGLSGMPASRFIVFAVLTCMVWAMVIGGLGYFFGHAATRWLSAVAKYEKAIALIVLVAGALLWWVRGVWQKRQKFDEFSSHNLL